MTDDFRKDLFIKARLCRTGKYLQSGSVKTYYEVYGQGEPLLLFHGGMSTIDTFRFQIPAFAKHYQVILPERTGHGHTADRPGPFSYEQMAEEMLGFMDAMEIKKAKMLGYSDGANLILYMARMAPERVERFVSVGGNYHHEGCLAEFQEELKQMSDESVQEGIDRNYQKYSPDGCEHYLQVFIKTRELWLTQPTFTKEDLQSISMPALIMAGEHDVISLEHTQSFYKNLPCAQLSILPEASHSLLKEYPELANKTILNFLKQNFN